MLNPHFGHFQWWCFHEEQYDIYLQPKRKTKTETKTKTEIKTKTRKEAKT